jgi:hypothetical protein
MATEDFDLDAALRNVQSAGGRTRKVERAHVFLPGTMRAERKLEERTQTEALERMRAGHKVMPKQVPWYVKQPVWDNLGRQPVQRSAPKTETEAAPAPPSARMFGCSICGNKGVQCKDDGSPYEHKCKHRVWCRTKSGHPECPECEQSLIVRMEQAKHRQSTVQRQFAINVKQAEQDAPKVGWDLVEVSRPVPCPICQTFLQGQRAVRVWIQKDGAWVVNNVQCLSHRPRPGIPLPEGGPAHERANAEGG